MTKKERVKLALSHEKTHITPYNIELTSQELEKVSEAIGIAPADFFEFAGNHIEKINYNRVSDLGSGKFKDEFGVIWKRNEKDRDIGIAEARLKEPDAKGISFHPDEEMVRIVTQKTVGNAKDTFKLGKIGTCYFERAWSLRGFENFLADMALYPAFAEELFDIILQYNITIIEIALQYDIDGFYFGDDYGQQTGLIMSPDMWRKYIKPGLAQMFGRIRSAGKIAALHSCGDISLILDDLVDIGLNVYQTVQPEIYDLKKLKAQYGTNLSFWGAISTQRTLPYVKPKELRQIVQDTISVLGKGGGYIAGPTHQVPDDVPVENIIELIRVLKNEKA
jgi:uroporphyrinogen decarboxylase